MKHCYYRKGGRAMEKRRKRGIGLLLIVLLLAGVLVGVWWKKEEKPKKEVSNHALKVTLFKVGKADAIVLEKENYTMVIDVGEEEDGEEVVAYLKGQGKDTVNDLVITHFDKDHVGGADTLVEDLYVQRAIIPNYQGQTVEYSDFIQALKEKQVDTKTLNENMEFTVQDMNVLIEPPLSYELSENIVEMDNNFSLITTITHGRNRLVFMGDAEKQRIREWLKTGEVGKCDFLKVAHHGVYETELKTLLDKLKPECAAICTSHKNPADKETLEELKKRNVRYFETKDGNITVISDGKDLELHQKVE